MDAISRLRSLRTLHGDRPFLVDAASGSPLTYAEAWSRAEATAGRLHDLGVSRGDRVLVDGENSIDLALLYLAALGVGVAVVPIGEGVGARELERIADASWPKAVVARPQATRLRALADARALPVLDIGFKGRGGVELFDGVRSSDLASVHFTSGTTGGPRGVAHRISDFVENGSRFATALELGPSDRFHSTLPMTYLGGYYNLLLVPMLAGASVVIDAPFGALAAVDPWRVPIAQGVNVLWFPPTILAVLLRLDRGKGGRSYARDSVRFALVGMAPLSSELRTSFEEAYGLVVHENYALAETLFLTTSTPSRPAPPGSAGYALPGIAVEIADDGVVLASTPDLGAGYVVPGGLEDFPQRDGMLDTGDLGTLGPDGLRITGRVKEIAIRGGLNISTRGVEEGLGATEGIIRLAAIGVPHDVLGEEVAVVVVCEPGIDLVEVEPKLRRTANEVFEPAQRPAFYVQIDELPLTTSGKVRKGLLRDLVIDRLGLAPAAKGFTVDPPAKAHPAVLGAGTLAAPAGMVEIPPERLVARLGRSGECAIVVGKLKPAERVLLRARAPQLALLEVPDAELRGELVERGAVVVEGLDGLAQLDGNEWFVVVWPFDEARRATVAAFEA
jgi:long-chain acyl-CoA synthetase